MSKLLKRTHMCGVLTKENIGETVTLNGWVAKQRSLGSLIFADLRDKTGITQIVFDDTIPEETFQLAESLRSEYVIGVSGTVRERSSKNPDLPTGDIEVLATDLVLYSAAETPPIYIKDDDNVDMNLRLKYRYLDLRKLKMQRNLTFRHNVCKLARDYFDQQGFTEVETPMLVRSTPEGARDYLVPSRVNKGHFYALPQSPQLFKQLLMVGGTDRYFQIVKCFRDEDLRADRQPEFTQMDLEMSFVDQDDVIAIQEGFLQKLFREMMGVEISLPLPRIRYDEAMERYGSDKPDTRFGFELKCLNDTEAVKATEFKVFRDALDQGGDVRGICIDGGSPEFSRKNIDKLTEETKAYGARGVVWIRVEEDGFKSSVNKFFTQEEFAEIVSVFDAKPKDLILIVADQPKVVFDSLGFLRRRIAGILGLLDNTKFNLLWVVDFPMFEKNEEGEITAMHHPFTHPKEEDIPLLDTDPLAVKADAYDIVLNGVEMGGGSVRIHDRALQQKMFDILGISKEESQRKFGFLLEAFKYGTPPHAGLAYGLDRMIMLLTGEESIREVMAFPKNQNAQCLVSDAPNTVDDAQLEELGITVIE
ncbi:aspartyl-tRNA synthetase [Eubacterium pyruvativorans]|uniref:Aspartate--tRNA ligase n=3 Tax=Eubacterium TaxID=1730 RepID=A0A1I7EZD4_9FIRM|nr:aspartate--tRNA ligase [Eubacterium pyruvativorans]SFN92277.1 aspartyl-tRNA synthetase [Eubacterium pyruvativorans]SFU29261.1 aspartyl-tRNA synthetase [Eubacterium pyruvativorans]